MSLVYKALFFTSLIALQVSPVQGASSEALSVERTLLIDWEGVCVRHKALLRRNSAGKWGELSFGLPDEQTSCRGLKTSNSKGNGSWRIECDNGLHAHGAFTAHGRGEGLLGVGRDSQGREIRFSLMDE